jgi:hypothetical protein
MSKADATCKSLLGNNVGRDGVEACTMTDTKRKLSEDDRVFSLRGTLIFSLPVAFSAICIVLNWRMLTSSDTRLVKGYRYVD